MLLVTSDLYRFDDFELHPSRRLLLRRGEKVALAPKTFEVLLFLVRSAGRVVSKEELLKAVWPDSFVEESNLTQQIFWLRKALSDKSGHVVTFSGRGYEFVGPVTKVQADEPELPAKIQPTVSVSQVSVPQVSVTVQEHSRQRAEIVFEEISTQAPRVTLRHHRHLRPALIGSAVLLAAGLAAWAGVRWMHRAGVVPGDHHEVVLADFDNATGDPSFDPALKTLLAIDLDESPFLVVAGDSETRKTLLLMKRPPNTLITPDVGREICQRMNDQAVLSGAIAKFGQKYLVTLTAADCPDGRTLVQIKAIADGREAVLKAVDTVASEMRGRLGESLKSHSGAQTDAVRPLPPVHTFSLEALRVYSQAEALTLMGLRREAIPLYIHATELDPKFAAAYLGLAKCYRPIGEERLGREAITKAYELRDQGDDLLRLSIVSYYNISVTGDINAYLRNLTAWTETYPRQAQPWIDLASVERGIGRHDLAIEPARTAVALAPDNGNAYAVLCGALTGVGRLEEAKAVCDEAIRRHIDTPLVRLYRYNLALLQHDMTAAEEQIARSQSNDDEGILPSYEIFTEGKAHTGVALWLQNIDHFRKLGRQERADHVARILLRREADYGMDAELRQQLAALDPNQDTQNMVIANAGLDRVQAAEAGLKILTAAGGDTIDINYHNVQAKAAVALARHRPEEAIADLELARPYDFVSLEGMSMRARAYLAAHQAEMAEKEFRRVIEHDFVAPGTPSIPLAHLGLARAYELEGNHAASKREYETLFDLWKNADPDLAPLLQARAEYARLP